MTNLTDEGLRGMTRELCLKMEHEHDSIFFNQSDFNYILHALQQVRDAAKKETVEKCAKVAESLFIIAKADECPENYCPSAGEHACDIATAIRQMGGGK